MLGKPIEVSLEDVYDTLRIVEADGFAGSAQECLALHEFHSDATLHRCCDEAPVEPRDFETTLRILGE